MDDSEFPPPAEFPPEDEAMILPPPTSQPWAVTQNRSLPSSAFAPCELGNMLFLDFTPIQTQVDSHQDNSGCNHEGNAVNSDGRMWGAQCSPDYYANDQYIFFENTWEDGLQSIGNFDWPVAEPLREGEDSIQDETISTQEARNTSIELRNTKVDPQTSTSTSNAASATSHDVDQDASMEYVQEDISTVVANQIIEQASPDDQSPRLDIMEEIAGANAKHASGSNLRIKFADGTGTPVHGEQDEETSLVGNNPANRMDLEAKTATSEGKQIHLPLRPSFSADDGRPAKQDTNATLESVELDESNGTQVEGEESSDSQARQHDAPLEATYDDMDIDLVGDEVLAEIKGSPSMSTATRDVDSAKLFASVPQQSTPESLGREGDLKSTTQDEIASSALPVAHGEFDTSDAKYTPDFVVSSPMVTEKQDIEDTKDAAEEHRDRTSGPKASGMKVLLVPQVTDTADAGDEENVADTPLPTRTQVDPAKRTRPTRSNTSCTSDRDAPAKKKPKTSHADQVETSEAASPEAISKNRTSLKSPKESTRESIEVGSATSVTKRETELRSAMSAQSPALERSEDYVEDVVPEQRDSTFITNTHHDEEEVAVEASTGNDYDMEERLSDIRSSPAKPSQTSIHPSSRPVKNSVSNHELASLASNLTPGMHVGHGGPASRTRKPATARSGYYREDEEDEKEEGEEYEPTPVVNKKKRSGATNRKSLPAAKKAKTQQPPRKRAAIGIKSEQRRRGDSEVDGKEADEEEEEGSGATPTPIATNDDDQEDDFEPTPTPTTAPYKTSPTRKPLPKLAPKPPASAAATATPLTLAAVPKKNKFGFSSPRASPKKTRSRVAKDAADAGEKEKSSAKGKEKVSSVKAKATPKVKEKSSSAKGKARASTGVE